MQGVYGSWPQEGEVDVMEWVWELQNVMRSSLHWKSRLGLNKITKMKLIFGGYDGTPDNFPVSMHTLSSDWITYGVELSADPQDAYVQFYMRLADSSLRQGRKVCQCSSLKCHFQSSRFHHLTGAHRSHPSLPVLHQAHRIDIIVEYEYGEKWRESLM
jgi:hypothetical protein